MTAIDRLVDAIERTGNPTALGLDTRPEYLPRSLLAKPGNFFWALRSFNCDLIDAVADIIPCVKIQVAFYETLGPSGMQVLRSTLIHAYHKGMVTIADAKRGDIGSTAEAYAGAYLCEDESQHAHCAYPADFVTVNGYLGIDGITPFLDICEESGGGIFVLVRTSNPSAGEFQDLPVSGKDGPQPLYEYVGRRVAEWGEGFIGERGYSSVGAVVGATWPEEAKKLRALLPYTFFLVPGYGAQGATAKDLAGCFDERGRGAVVNASRSLIAAHMKLKTDDYASVAREEALKMRDDLRSAIKGLKH